jgi:vancomycin resistance protein VanW
MQLPRKRRLFCEISPLTYAVSVRKERALRHLRNLFGGLRLAAAKGDKLPIVQYRHKSLIRRKLGDVDMALQENKAVNLSIAAPKIDGVLIRPGEAFSFWHLVGAPTARRGYREGLLIAKGQPARGIGGGMCQFTNLIHWLVLHSPLNIIEHHHHDGVDIFPDFGRIVPFGCGTSIVYNYLDYRFKNNTLSTFQLITYVTDTHLCGELRVCTPCEHSYSIKEENARFVKIENDYFRQNKVVRRVIDKRTGNELGRNIIKQSNARVMYDPQFINKDLLF